MRIGKCFVPVCNWCNKTIVHFRNLIHLKQRFSLEKNRRLTEPPMQMRQLWCDHVCVASRHKFFRKMKVVCFPSSERILWKSYKVHGSMWPRRVTWWGQIAQLSGVTDLVLHISIPVSLSSLHQTPLRGRWHISKNAPLVRLRYYFSNTRICVASAYFKNNWKFY